MQAVLIAILIFLCRVMDVSLGTLRMLYMVRGHKYIAGTIGFFEVSIFLWAISSVVGKSGNWMNFIAYGLGFAAGTILGITIEEKLAPGNLNVTIFSREQFREIAEALRDMGFGVTETLGRGKGGMLEILNSIIYRKDFPMLLETVRQIDPEAFITSDQMNFVNRGYLHRIKRK